MSWQLILADLIVAVHLGIVLYVILFQLAVIVGILRGWAWLERPWLRCSHLLVMAFVAIQASLGRLCPLTIWEYELRAAAGAAPREGSFVGRLLHDLLYVEASPATLTAYYVGFLFVVVLTLLAVPPRRRRPE